MPVNGYPRYNPEQYRDPHQYNHRGPIPRWRPDQQKPWRPGQPKGAFIWPRDKGITNSPSHSWRRLKDVLTGKGPGIWIGDRRKFGPHRPTWSNWPMYDNLGYQETRNEVDEVAGFYGGPETKRYDFRTRKYQIPTRYTWSDAKWERRRHPKHSHYNRNVYGQEWCELQANSGWPGTNVFRYRDNSPWFDWGRPRRNHYYYNRYMPA